MFDHKLLIHHQSKTDSDVKTCGKNSHHLDLEIRKMLLGGLYGNENSKFHSCPLFTCHCKGGLIS